MEHNVKIKDYKRDTEAGPLASTLRILDNPKNYPSLKEQQRLMGRFTDFHWERENVLHIRDHADRMYILRHQANEIEEKQSRELRDYEEYRMQHLEGIKGNIERTRERFYRSTERDRKVNLQENGPNPDRTPLYKIVNDGIPIKY